jgi:hypothetical protein
VREDKLVAGLSWDRGGPWSVRADPLHQLPFEDEIYEDRLARPGLMSECRPELI